MNLKSYIQFSTLSFPSPIGELHFSISNRAVASAITDLLFPSPIGELHFSITTHNIEDYWNNLFPSPIGELHFSLLQLMLHHRNTQSFRPLSGSYISQSWENFHYMDVQTVSVPYRGATFLNSLDVAHATVCRTFPSPIGELHFSINKGGRGKALKFPSPIGELHFSIPSPQPHVLSGTNRGIAGEK